VNKTHELIHVVDPLLKFTQQYIYKHRSALNDTCPFIIVQYILELNFNCYTPHLLVRKVTNVLRETKIYFHK